MTAPFRSTPPSSAPRRSCVLAFCASVVLLGFATVSCGRVTAVDATGPVPTYDASPDADIADHVAEPSVLDAMSDARPPDSPADSSADAVLQDAPNDVWPRPGSGCALEGGTCGVFWASGWVDCSGYGTDLDGCETAPGPYYKSGPICCVPSDSGYATSRPHCVQLVCDVDSTCSGSMGYGGIVYTCAPGIGDSGTPCGPITCGLLTRCADASSGVCFPGTAP